MQKREVKRITLAIRPQLQSLIEKGKLREIPLFLKRAEDQFKIRFSVIAPSGKIISPSFKKNKKNSQQQTKMGQIIFYTLPVTLGSNATWYIVASSDSKTLNPSLFQSLKVKIASLILATILLALIISYFLAKYFSEPVRDLKKAADSISHEEFDARVKTMRNDELGELGESFNRMSEKLKELFLSLKERERELETIIEFLNEGLAVIDTTDRIKIANGSFKGFTKTDWKEKFYWEILNSPELIQSIEEARKNHKPLLSETEIKGKDFLLSVTPIPVTGEIIVLLRDITEMRKLEIIKKDLIANVSHELRTPLTAIKGYAETLEEEIPSELKKYVNVIIKNSERLINLVNDLTTLSKIEKSEKNEKEFVDVDLGEVTTGVFSLMKSLAEKKGLNLKIEIKGDPVIKGNPDNLNQMLINLVDNAIKYTDQGEVKIEVEDKEDEVILKVSDTGIGIPESEIPRIFERFYVIDKSRSRKSGGTGLGLSIVKHVVLSHNGKIEVKSKQGEGSQFSIKFPKISGYS